MGMTRAEAIERLEKLIALYEMSSTENKMIDYSGIIDTLKFSLSALRPVSREQVEKVWPGCEACKNAGLAIGEVQFYGPFEGSIDVSGNVQYCPNCGRPITPAAQEGQLERLEALKDGMGD